MTDDTRIHYLYRVINTVNGKIYIGQSVDTRKRWYDHKREAAQDNPASAISRAIKKYSNNAFEFEVIAGCKKWEDANDTETLLVQQYNSQVPNGYNVAPGGINAPKSEEWKQIMRDHWADPAYHDSVSSKISETVTEYHKQRKEQGLPAPGAFKLGHEVKPEWLEAAAKANTGRVHSENEKTKRSQSLIEFHKQRTATNQPHWFSGKSSHMLGKTHTKETRMKISNTNKGRHLSFSTEFQPGLIPWNKRITSEQEVEIMGKHQAGQSQRSLAKEYNIDRSSIKRIINKASQ